MVKVVAGAECQLICKVCSSDLRVTQKECCLSSCVHFVDKPFLNLLSSPCDCDKSTCRTTSGPTTLRQNACPHIRATATLPDLLDFATNDQQNRVVVSRVGIPLRALFGPVIIGDATPNSGSTLQASASDLPFTQSVETFHHWMQFVSPASGNAVQNLVKFMVDGAVYFAVIKAILPGEELRFQSIQSTPDLSTPCSDTLALESVSGKSKSANPRRKIRSHAPKTLETTEQSTLSRQFSPEIEFQKPAPQKRRRDRSKAAQVESVVESYPSTLPRSRANSGSSTRNATVLSEDALSTMDFSINIDGPDDDGDVHSVDNEVEHRDSPDNEDTFVDTTEDNCHEDLPEIAPLASDVIEPRGRPRKPKATAEAKAKTAAPRKRQKRGSFGCGRLITDGFECIYCRACFKDDKNPSRQLKEHLDTLHVVDGVYICPSCPKKCRDYATLAKHLYNVHNPKAIPCNVCGKTFGQASSLNIHMLTHTVASLKCPHCPVMFKSKTAQDRHVRMYHDPAGPKIKMTKQRVKSRGDEPYEDSFYKCRECKLRFTFRNALVSHMEARHPDTPLHTVQELNLPMRQNLSYACVVCKNDNSFATADMVLAHLERRHPETKEDRDSAAWVASQTKTADNMVFWCEMCSTPVQSGKRFIRHVRNNHPDYLTVLAPQGMEWMRAGRDSDTET